SRLLRETESILQRKKEGVTFAEIVVSEGIKELLKSIGADIEELSQQEEAVAGEIKALEIDLRPDRKRKKEILEFYQARMREYLNQLNVHVLEEDDYGSL